MEHFLFSCRILGMGIEQYVYNKLGCPKFVISGDVAIRISDISALHSDGNGKHVVFLKDGLWIEVSYGMYRKIMGVIWNT